MCHKWSYIAKMFMWMLLNVKSRYALPVWRSKTTWTIAVKTDSSHPLQIRPNRGPDTPKECGDRPLHVSLTQILHEECKERRICSLVWNRTLFWRAAALNIFIQVQCQILHYIRRKRQLLGWLSCGSVNVWDLWASHSSHQQLLHTEAQLDTTPW